MPEEWYEKAHFFRRFVFRFGDCDMHKKASLYAMMKLFSEMAGEDYEGRGLGHTLFWEHGQAFLLARMALRFHRLPEYGESVVAVTWEREKKGAFFNRDYEIRDTAGNVLVSATSLWFIVNPDTREVLRPADVYGGLREGDPEKADAPVCKRIHPDASLPLLGERKIVYSDIDANGHVNNAIYGRIAGDFLPDEYRSRGVSEFYIDFKTETKLGDTLNINGAPCEGGYAIQGLADGQLHFAARYICTNTL